MALTYNDVPQATQTVASSQVPIRTNFQSIQTLVDVNHYDFNNDLYGKHKFVEMPNQSGDPTTFSAEMTLYSKQYNNGVTTQSEAFVRRDAAGTPIPFTAGVGNNGNEGWCFLPAGMLMAWGTLTVTVPDAITIVPTGPTLTAFYIKMISFDYNPGGVNSDNFSWYTFGETFAPSPRFGVNYDVGASGITTFKINYLVIGAATP